MIKRGPSANLILGINQTAELISAVVIEVVPKGPLYVQACIQADNVNAGVARFETAVMVDGVEVVAATVLLEMLQFENNTTTVVHEILNPRVGMVIRTQVDTPASANRVTFFAGRSWLWVFGEGFQGA